MKSASVAHVKKYASPVCGMKADKLFGGSAFGALCGILAAVCYVIELKLGTTAVAAVCEPLMRPPSPPMSPHSASRSGF